MYVIGDHVLLPTTRPSQWNSEGSMDKYLGKSVQITNISVDRFFFEGSDHWYFKLSQIQGLDLSKEGMEERQERIKKLECYKFNIGDVVVCKKIEKNGNYAQDSSGGSGYSLGKVFKIRDIDENYVVFNNVLWPEEGGNGVYAYAVELASAEVIEQFEKEKQEKIKNCIYKKEDVELIAKEVFGERCEVIEDKGLIIMIHFPEITITNSNDRKHEIKDLFVKFRVYDIFPEQDSKCSIGIQGCRTTLSLAEWNSDYGHSHLSGTCFCNFNGFCLGTSDFKIVIENLKLSLSRDDWYLLFYSLENYVNWESLEGGPYRKIKDITLGNVVTSEKALEEEVLRLLPEIPSDCFEFNEGVSLISNHPSLFNYYNENSKIKTITTVDSQIVNSQLKRINEEYDRQIIFKGEVIKGKVYWEIREESQFQKEVADKYNEILNKELKKFNADYEYTITKQSKYSEIFGEIRTL